MTDKRPTAEALAKVARIRDGAVSMGWTDRVLFELALTLQPGETLGEISERSIEIIPADRHVGGLCLISMRFPNFERLTEEARGCMREVANSQ